MDLGYLLEISDQYRLESELKRFLQSLGQDKLPLQQALSQSSMVSDTPFNVLILNASKDNHIITARAGIQYHGIVAGCSCADDPSPVPEIDEYCELSVRLDAAAGSVDVELLA